MHQISDWQYNDELEELYNVRCPQKRVFGLCRTLKRAFYKRRPRKSKQTPVSGQAVDQRGTKQKRKKSAKREGTEFDEQVTYRIQHRGIDRENARRHRYLDKYWRYLSKHGYKPVGAQVGVGSMTIARCPLSTRIDAVVSFGSRSPPVEEEKREQKSRKEVVLIENKCRSKAVYAKPARESKVKMEPPFQSVSDTVYYHDQLQLAFGKALFELTFPDIAVVGAMVLRVDDDGVGHYKLESRFNKLPTEAWEALFRKRR